MPITTKEECLLLRDAAVVAESKLGQVSSEMLKAVHNFQHHFIVELGRLGVIDPEAARAAAEDNHDDEPLN